MAKNMANYRNLYGWLAASVQRTEENALVSTKLGMTRNFKVKAKRVCFK